MLFNIEKKCCCINYMLCGLGWDKVKISVVMRV